jgi:hypothetical protein
MVLKFDLSLEGKNRLRVSENTSEYLDLRRKK